MSKKRACSGFSVLELLIVMSAMSVVAAMSLPSLQRTLRTYRIAGDARGIAQTLTLAKMRAASNFTLEAVDWDSSSNSFLVKFFQKNLAAGAYQGQFHADDAVQNVNLSSGIALGPPSSGDSSTVGASNNSRVLFNSRGLPVDTSFNPINAAEAFYFNNGTDYYAVSVAVSGRVQIWKYIDSAWVVQ
jgi:prepilin-type N-terminal cleavage/methylation domain-containing protein